MKRSLFTLFPLLGLLAGCGGVAEQTDSRESDSAVKVAVTRVGVQSWELITSTVGTLFPWEQVTLVSAVAGDVVDLLGREGAFVTAGQVLVRLDDTVYRAEKKRADAQLKEALSQFRRQESLFRREAVSEAEWITAQAALERAEADLMLADRRLQDTEIRAPFDGRLGRRLVAPGELLSPGTAVFELTQSHPLRLEFFLPERFQPFMETAMHVSFTTAGNPGEVFQGQVEFVDPRIDLESRTLRLRARVDNEEGHLQANAFARIQVRLRTIPEAVVIPEEALITELGGFFVYTVDAERRARMIEVTPADRRDGLVRLENGLEPGTRIIRDGHHRISEGSLVSWSEGEESNGDNGR